MEPEVGFKLGGLVLERLLEIFLFSDFSVKRFLLGYKVSQYQIFHNILQAMLSN